MELTSTHNQEKSVINQVDKSLLLRWFYENPDEAESLMARVLTDFNATFDLLDDE